MLALFIVLLVCCPIFYSSWSQFFFSQRFSYRVCFLPYLFFFAGFTLQTSFAAMSSAVIPLITHRSIYLHHFFYICVCERRNFLICLTIFGKLIHDFSMYFSNTSSLRYCLKVSRLPLLMTSWRPSCGNILLTLPFEISIQLSDIPFGVTQFSSFASILIGLV